MKFKCHRHTVRKLHNNIRDYQHFKLNTSDVALHIPLSNTNLVFLRELSLKTSLNPPLFTEVSVPSQESERSCICVLGASFTILILNIGTVSSVAFFVFHFIRFTCILNLVRHDIAEILLKLALNTYQST